MAKILYRRLHKTLYEKRGRRQFSIFTDTCPGIASCKKFISANLTIALLWCAAQTAI